MRNYASYVKNQSASSAEAKGISAMRLTFMWKDPASQQGSCPALYEAENGYVVQGTKLDAATRAQLRDMAADEDGVFVPAPILDRLRGVASDDAPQPQPRRVGGGAQDL